MPISPEQRALLDAYFGNQSATPDIGGAEAALRGALQGVTFGFGDELAAGAEAGIRSATGDERSFREIYSSAIENARKQENTASKQNPWTYGGSELVTGIATPLGALGKATSIPALIGSGAALGGASAAGHSEADNYRELALDTAAGAALGGVITPVIAKGVNALGRPLSKAVESVKNAVRPEDISVTINNSSPSVVDDIAGRLAQYGDDVVASFKQGVKSGLTPEQAATQSLGKRYGVKLSLGDITQDVGIQGREDAALKGVLGQPAQMEAQAFRSGQNEEIGNLVGMVSNRISGSGNAAQVDDVGAALASRIKSLAKADKASASAKYKAAETLQASYPAEALRELPRIVRRATRDYDTAKMPVFQERLGELERYLGRKSIKDVKLSAVEVFRKRINANMPQQGTPEAAALGILKKTLTDVEDDLVSQNLIKGTPEAIDAARAARGAWSNYMQKYFGGEDGKLFERIVKKDLTPKEVVDGVIGSGNVGLAKSARVVDRIKGILGEESDEFGAIKNHLLHRLTGLRDTNQLTNGAFMRETGRRFSNNLAEMKAKNPGLYNAVFNESDRALLDDAARIMQRVYEKQPGAINYSNTTPALLRLVNSIGGKLPLGKYAAGAANKAYQGFEEAMNANEVRRSFAGDMKLFKEAAKKAESPIGRALATRLGSLASGEAAESISDSRKSSAPKGGITDEQRRLLDAYFAPESTAKRNIPEAPDPLRPLNFGGITLPPAPPP